MYLIEFVDAGELLGLVVETCLSYFDIKVTHYLHFLLVYDVALMDIPGEHIALAKLPALPAGLMVSRVDVVVRVTRGK